MILAHSSSCSVMGREARRGMHPAHRTNSNGRAKRIVCVRFITVLCLTFHSVNGPISYARGDIATVSQAHHATPGGTPDQDGRPLALKDPSHAGTAATPGGSPARPRESHSMTRTRSNDNAMRLQGQASIPFFEHQRRIVTPKPEVHIQRRGKRHVAALIGHVIEVTIRVRRLVIDRGRYDARP